MPRPGSLANLVFELEIITGGTSFVVPAHQFLQSIEIEASVGSTFTGSITLFDPEGEFLEDLFIAAGLDRGIRFRWNWDRYGIDTAPTFEGSIITYTPTFQPQGIQLVLNILAKPVLPCVLDKRTRSYQAGSLISDIVLSIADERGWPTVDIRGNSTIEPTGESIDQPFSTTDESDLRFIAEQLRPQAVNAQGQGGYVFFFDQYGAVHFHTRLFLPPLVRTYTFARDVSGEVISFSPTDNSVMASLFGSTNVAFRGQSSLNASPVGSDGTATEGLDQQPEVAEESATAIPDYGEGLHAAVNIMSRDAAELGRLAKDRRERARNATLTGELVVIGTHDVGLLEFVDVQVLRKDGTLHYLSGSYQLQKIRHTVDSSGWQTAFDVVRTGLKPSTPGTEAMDNVVTISTSPTGTLTGV